jgi:hypothetical protein
LFCGHSSEKSSHFEIGGDNPCSRHLSESQRPVRADGGDSLRAARRADPSNRRSPLVRSCGHSFAITASRSSPPWRGARRNRENPGASTAYRVPPHRRVFATSSRRLPGEKRSLATSPFGDAHVDDQVVDLCTTRGIPSSNILATE